MVDFEITDYARANGRTDLCNQTIFHPRHGWTTAVHPVLCIGSYRRGQFSFKA